MNAPMKQQSATPVADYIAHGWKLCAVTPNSKSPTGTGWNKVEQALTEPPSDGYGIGLMHAYSGTAALDIDQWAEAAVWLAERGIILPNLTDAPDAVGIDSGNAGHGKLLYALPFPLPTKKVVIEGKTILEFRCGTASGLSSQDLLPPSRHPSGTTYKWTGSGNWQQLPTMPDEILAIWMQLLEGDAQKNIKVEGEQSPVSIDELRQAMFAVSPDCDRKPWTEIGMGWKAAGGDRDSWEEWSSGSKEKYHPSEIESQWKSFDEPDKVRKDGIGPGTVFFHARAAGWKHPAPDVKGLFRAVEVAPQGEGTVHPLTVEYQHSDAGTEFVIDGMICEGFVVLAADRGAGKTTATVALATKAAWLCPENDPLCPTIRRHVVYVTEHPQQVAGILHGMREAGQLGLNANVGEWIHIVHAHRMTAAEIVQAVPTYLERWSHPTTRNGVTFNAPPWVVYDTASAVIKLDEENSNTDISDAVATLKQALLSDVARPVPFLVVGHVAKAIRHASVENMTMRGGGAWEADAYQVMYLSNGDGATRYFEIGHPNAKKRFDSTWYCIEVLGKKANRLVRDRFGQVIMQAVWWASLTPMNEDDSYKSKQAKKDNADARAVGEAKAKVREWFVKHPDFQGSKGEVWEAVGGNRTVTFKAIQELNAEGVLFVVDKYVRKDGKNGSNGVGLSPDSPWASRTEVVPAQQKLLEPHEQDDCEEVG